MSINKIITVAALSAVLILAGASSVIGQIIYGQPTAGNVNLEYISWTIEDSSTSVDMSQVALPISGFVPIRDNLEMRFSVANVTSTLDDGADDYSLSGLSDLRLQINQSMAEDQFLLSLGFNLPTGTKELSLDEEYRVLQVLSRSYLEFPIRHLGGGLGVNLMAGGAAMAGEWRLGLALTYQMNGSYTPYEDYEDYDPGDQVSVIAGADLLKGRHSLSTQAVFSTYSVDKVDGAKILDQGDILDLRLSHRFDHEAYGVNMVAGYLIRGQNASYDTTETVISELKLYGDEFYFRGAVAWVPAEKWSITPMVELRLIGEDEADFESSNLLGFGGSVGRRVGEKTDASVGVTYYTGSADGGDLDISGLRLSIGITGTF